MREPGEMGEPAADCLLVGRALQHPRDCLIAGRGLVAAEVEHAVLGENRADVALCPGIRARRMAGDQIIDREPILDGADALLECAVLCAVVGVCHAVPPALALRPVKRRHAAMALATMPRRRSCYLATGAT